MSKSNVNAQADLKEYHLSNFTPEVEAAERKKHETLAEFKPSYEAGVGAAEFVLGGFNFEYQGGYRRDEILKKTSDEAERMIASAKERVEEIEQEAFYKGFKEGVEKGRKEGYGEAISLMSALREGLEGAQRARGEYYAKAEKEAVDLIILVTSEMVRHSVEQDRGIATEVFRKAVGELRGKQRITARFNPADFEFAQITKEDLLRSIQQIESLEMKADPAISPGGCVLETNIGELDATVEKRLLNIHENLRAQGAK